MQAYWMIVLKIFTPKGNKKQHCKLTKKGFEPTD
jgi:hypothetical protein